MCGLGAAWGFVLGQWVIVKTMIIERSFALGRVRVMLRLVEPGTKVLYPQPAAKTKTQGAEQS